MNRAKRGKHAGNRANNGDPDTIVPKPDNSKTKPDWTKKCEVCGATPIVPLSGMCGPCTFGEADTAGGNW